MQHEVGAVVFDMDGLMLDTEPLYKTAWQRTATELGYTLEDASYSRLVGRPNADCERVLLELLGSGFPLDRFRSRWPDLWHAHVEAHGIAPKDGLLGLLAFADARNLPMAVATSSDAEYLAFSLRHAGLDREQFSAIVTGDEIARGKPAPDIFLEAARRLGVEPEHCVALEDSEAGIVAAHRAGMIALLIPDWIAPSETATRAAYRVLASLDDARALVERLVNNADSFD